MGDKDMAIRERPGRARPFQVYWNNPFTGKRESKNFATREEAEKEDSLVKHRLRFERESFKHEEKKDILTLEAVYMAYLREKQFNKKGIAWQMDAMRLALRELGQKEIAAISIDDIIRLMNQNELTGVKPCTVRGRMSVLRTVMRWAADNGYCEQIRFPKLPSAQYEKLVPPTPAELSAIMHAAPEHIRRVIILGAQCGARVGSCELFVLTWKDLDLEQKLLRIHGAKKNAKAPWRDVPIREALAPLFAHWKEKDAAIGIEYIIHYRGKPVQSIKRAWAASLRRAGITRRIRPYDLRHAFATELIAAGADIGTVAKLMGHSSPTMILNHYQYVMDKQKRAAIESLPDFAHVPKAMCPKGECYQ